MAKMKQYAVEVEITVKRTFYVQARKPNGAADRLFTDEEWTEQTLRSESDEVFFSERRNAKVTNVREV